VKRRFIMRTKLTETTLAAGFALALAFTLNACGDGGDGDDDNPYSGLPEYEEMKEYYKYYDPDDHGGRCQNGIVEYKCPLSSGDVYFNPLKQHCCSRDENYDPDTGDPIYIYTLGTIERCGNVVIASNHDDERCQGGVYQEKCDNGEWYNPERQYCSSNWDDSTSIYTIKEMTKCGSKYYRPYDDTRCVNNVIEEKCGWEEDAKWYNPETHRCAYYYSNGNSNRTVVKRELCGGRTVYEEEGDRCNNGVLEYKCGEADDSTAPYYNPITQSCDWDTGTVKNKMECK
jgi:hypothetical protein